MTARWKEDWPLLQNLSGLWEETKIDPVHSLTIPRSAKKNARSIYFAEFSCFWDIFCE